MKIVSAIVCSERVEVECVRVVAVYEGAERETIGPTSGVVGHVHAL